MVTRGRLTHNHTLSPTIPLHRSAQELAIMKYRKPAPEKQERRNDENALAKFRNLTLEQQEPGT